jgi:FkbM family methyltransferase
VTSRPELDLLLSEDPSAADARAGKRFDEALSLAPNPEVVLYGAGNLARRTARSLLESGIRIAAWTDRDPTTWGREMEGIPILPPDEALRRHGATALWIVAIFNFRHCTGSTLAWLRERGVAHALPVQAWMWKRPEAFLPYFYIGLPGEVLRAADRIRQAWDLFTDDVSRSHILSSLRWRLSLDPATLLDPVAEVQYFPPSLLPLEPGEVFVDCGAYDGDTLRFMEEKGAFPRHAFAFEPDPDNFKVLETWIAGRPEGRADRVTAVRAGVGAGTGEIPFQATGTASSGSALSGNIRVPVVALDTALAGAPPTLIKMDIEGMELDALAGAAKTLERHRPKLAVCVYHAPEHLWEIPLAIHAMLPEHRLALRGHCQDGFDWVCYALPSR